MRIIADLHIHSSYSRATSLDMGLDSLAQWAEKKGISLIGTGDFTHPAYFASIEEKLEPAGPGLFVLKGHANRPSAPRFMLTAEVSNIFTQGGRTRKIHNLIFSPTLKAARKMNAAFAARGNVASDGRPIFGFSAKELIKIVLDASTDAMLVPAHAWTPWFSIFGSKSGFDSIEECFGEFAGHIHAIETGLSSNPQMNWRLSALDKIALLSNSDAHSPSKLGREANVFDCALDYYEITGAIKKRDKKKFLYTIEFFPEEGKYHSDGHRACGVRLEPAQTRKLSGVCPACGKGLTVGVLSRIEDLSDRPVGFTPPDAIPAKQLVPLQEIIAESIGAGVATVKVQREYTRLLSMHTEFSYLLDMDKDTLTQTTGARLATAIMKVRSSDISISPGYDGEFGKISIFGGKKPKDAGAGLFD
ncbi:MAG: DNA helicase UvrD [Deltaproteobacteria bacterium]|nr:DNA helicase UvrD [Deltaproteobacteria bacterium]